MWKASTRASEIKEIRKRAIQAGLQLVDCPIRHLGTEKAQQLYLHIQNYLAGTRRGDAASTPNATTFILEGNELQGRCDH